MEEYKITGTKSKFFLQGLKPKFANITRTKRGITLKKLRLFVN